MNRKILIIAFHFPPIASSSGMQRALKTVRYLREDGWEPIVLTASPRGYDRTSESQLSEIPRGTIVRRAFCLDAKRHFSVGGRYPGFLAWPDAWISWYPAAVMAGRQLIRDHRPSVIWSTFPINTSNLVARYLAKWSGLPWVVDLRDPITLPGYPPEQTRFRLARRIERHTMETASRVVFTAHYTRRIYIERYPSIKDKAVLIRNGYDEANFPERERTPTQPNKPLTILHSGSLQPKGRHPRAFIEAVANLKAAGKICAEEVRFNFRASGYKDTYLPLVEQYGIDDLVSFTPSLPYEEAISEMVAADGLLVFQGTAYNNAVPAKLYEYFFTGKPILGILDKVGETHDVLTEAEITRSASIDDSQEIAEALAELIRTIHVDSPFRANSAAIARYSRRNQTLKLSALLRDIVDQSQSGSG